MKCISDGDSIWYHKPTAIDYGSTFNYSFETMISTFQKKLVLHVILPALFIDLVSTNLLLAQEHASGLDNKKTTDAELVAQQLRNCPLWMLALPNDVEQRKLITDVYIKMTSYDTGTLREGIKRYLNGKVDNLFYADATVYAFLPVAFKLPQRYFIKGEHPWVMANTYHDDGSVDLLWPYSIDHHGHLVLTGGDGKAYFVGLASADVELAEFDFVASRFKRRTIKNWKK